MSLESRSDTESWHLVNHQRRGQCFRYVIFHVLLKKGRVTDKVYILFIPYVFSLEIKFITVVFLAPYASRGATVANAMCFNLS